MRPVQDFSPVRKLKLQRAWFPQLGENLLRVGNAGDLDVDPVRSFLVDMRFGRDRVDTLLELVHSVCHVLG